MLGSARPAFESDALVAVKSRLDEVAPDGLGLRIEGLTIHDLHPPQDVVGAYHAVAEAIQKRDRTINEAKSEASRLVAKASDDALRTVRTAEADAHRKTSEAKAASDVFLQWHRSRTTLTDAEERAAGDDPVKREQLLLVKRGLTDLRLALEAAANALKTRPKVLIDGDKFPGTRKLFLLDPDFLPKAVPPMAFPRPGPADQRDPP